MSKLVLSIVIVAFAAAGATLLLTFGNSTLAAQTTVIADDCTSGFGWDCVTPSPRP